MSHCCPAELGASFALVSRLWFAYLISGKVRAKQYYKKDETREKVVPIILHGDGSHAGQGVVYETYDMSGLPDYTVGGTIHDRPGW